MAEVATDNCQVVTSNSPFLRLPIELRLIIEEFAVTVDKPIVPVAVVDRANKFVWGDYELVQCPESKTQVFVSKEDPLTVTALARTCKTINYDLKYNPVFYRVNNFLFFHEESLYNFLAALTPERRKFLRHITMKINTNSWHLNQMTLARTGKAQQRNHTLSLLADCNDLRRFGFELSYRGLPDLPTMPWGGLYQNALQDIQAMQEQANTCKIPNAYWCLPTLKLAILLPEVVHEKMRSLEDEVEKLQGIVLARKKAAEPLFRKFFNPQRLAEALMGAKVDIVGEGRLDHSGSVGEETPISRRTRAFQNRSREINHSWGTFKQENENTSKYSKEGHLQWDIRCVRDSRHGEELPEFEVEYLGKTGDEKKYSWESCLSLLGTRHEHYLHLYFIRVRYLALEFLKSTEDPEALEQRAAVLRYLPGLREIIQEKKSMIKGPEDQAWDYFHTYPLRDWKYLKKESDDALRQFDEKIQKLKNEANSKAQTEGPKNMVINPRLIDPCLKAEST